LKLGFGVSLIDCGTSFTTFDTFAAFKDKGKLKPKKKTGNFSFLQNYGSMREGAGF